MKVLAVRGSPVEREPAVERLIERFQREGTVGAVTRSDGTGTGTEWSPGERYGDAGAQYRYSLTDDGWCGSGGPTTLDDVLADLAPECSYAVVEGFENADLDTVVVGERTVSEERPLARAPSAAELDVEAVVEQVNDADHFETLESLVTRVKDSAAQDKAGAIATFTGRVRKKETDEDDPTEYLEFERYDDVAAEKMATIRSELEDREGIYEVALHHRTGVVEAGEDIVFVVVLAGHREEAFETVEDGIDRLKAEVPLFKKEVTVEGTFWAHQHEQEHHPDDESEKAE